MNKCKHLKYRKRNYKCYLYCTSFKRQIQYDECKNCKFKEYKKSPVISEQFHSNPDKPKIKSNKITKMERNRISLFTDDLKKCYLCDSEYYISKHEIYCGRNRHNSMLYGLVLPLCNKCHTKYQNNALFNDKWHKLGQIKFIEVYPNLSFIDIFHINYL